MKVLLQFEWNHFFRKTWFYGVLLLTVLFGVFSGANFSISISPEIFKNSSYTVAYMTGIMSLLCIFFSTILTTQILFKETDANFTLILYATPIRKRDFLLSRFIAVFSMNFFCFALFVLGFAVGQTMPSDRGQYTDLRLMFYLNPLLVFGLVNSFFCSAMLCSIAWLSKNKLMVYVSGLLLYILYMVMLIFSGSPLMAKGMPQSPETILLSARLDPFGLSAYFMQTSTWSVVQRNTALIPLSGTLLFNRLGVIVISLLSLIVTFKAFTFSMNDNVKRKVLLHNQEEKTSFLNATLKHIQPSQSWLRHWLTLMSFTKLDLKYISRGIPFVLTCVALLFALGMEIYGSIEKGIRLPQKYATSGLMAKTIIDNFHGLCLIVLLYYANEIVWRSRNSNFQLIENATPASNTALFFSKWVTLSLIIVFFTTLMIMLGIVFQISYNYPSIDWQAYAGVYLFNSLPLIVSAGIILIIQKLISYKYVGLVISSVIVFFSATSLSSKLLKHPLLKFQTPYNGLYSDMNGFGTYLTVYCWKHLFGLSIVLIFAILITQLKGFKLKVVPSLCLLILMGTAYLLADKIIKDYQPKDEEANILAQIDYEKKYRVFHKQAQPTITEVKTTVDLFPEKNSYQVACLYTLQNKTSQPIKRILVNFAEGITIQETNLIKGNRVFKITNQYTVVELNTALLPKEKAQLKAKFSYHWSAVNGHQSFNVIQANGSFMRISRYFPTLGYITDKEIEHKKDRDRFNLGEATQLRIVDAPKDSMDDFINLDMTISTNKQQTAIGVGDLVKHWKDNDRNYFRYQTSRPVPFRFAVSSAEYAVKTSLYKGQKIEVYYHPTHYQNVDHLLKNAQLTMDYCNTNFSKLPFKTIRFAEMSAFTKGFAATAYPATIYMTEDMIFNANIGADKKQDVINELAGHELSHLWWGNNTIAPDSREGDVMLTETLAMYTELMLVKRMHRKARVMENVNMHLGMYLNERGFTDEQPLFKMQAQNVHLSYSKGLVVMYQLSELIGEEKINLALRQLLKKHAYPNLKPVSTDFIKELYAVTDRKLHDKIDDLFKRITLYDFKIKNASVKKNRKQYELIIDADVQQYYEDGKGHQSAKIMNDSIEISIHTKKGKEKKWMCPVINNKILGKMLLDEQPIEIEIDPDVKFIKKESVKQTLEIKPTE